MSQAPSRGVRMLVVDDEERNRKLIEGYLEGEGYELCSASDGADALKCVESFQPDVVLLDVMMPGLNGYDVCRAIKSDPKHKLCQVMMVTALSGDRNTVEGLDTGADDFVSKPVRREEFLAKVRALVRVRETLLDLDETSRQLAERNRELELKKMLAQSIVHDLKSPLQVVLGNLELLARKEPQLSEQLGRCRDSAKRMQKMIMDLLDVEALAEGRLTVDCVENDAVAVAREAVDDLRSQATIVGVELELEVDVWN